ncbi:putative xyloglucan endotransglucosylase/hydrolase protein 26 [Ananas comosus]|uniref:Xyloglucan endotransglucosylase/hydrolase n=1 Tax=Ananas comosus TaxID=4615 RepID=A0A199UNC3_ANACO|nr:putative xyloglucan endotransglucosylase/hydrolase protein 26 [Ananas comosus]
MAMGKPRAVLVAFALLVVLDRGLVRANFYDECDVTWGPQNTAIWGSGENLALSLDSDHIGSAIRTKKQFLFGSVEMEIQLVPDNSAGTVTAYYIPIRVYRNYESAGAPFPTNQPMRMYSSLWNADDWACQGGRVKTDWSKAPFVAKYRNLKLDVCECESADSISQCYSSSNWYNGWQYSKLTAAQLGQMNWVQQNYKIYDYCTDYKRFNGQMAVECSLPQY